MPAVCLSCPGLHLLQKASLLHLCRGLGGGVGVGGVQERRGDKAEVLNVTRQLTNKNLNRTSKQQRQINPLILSEIVICLQKT